MKKLSGVAVVTTAEGERVSYTYMEQDDSGMLAEVGIALSGIRHSFVTRNLHEPGRRVQMQLVKGPFSRLDGDWHFHAVGDGSQRAARVELLEWWAQPQVQERARELIARQEKWQRIAGEAAKQCGRTLLPVVEPIADLGVWLAEMAAAPDTAAFFCYENEQRRSAADFLAAAQAHRYAALVGPEGGFTPAEAAQAAAAGVQAVTLGPRILRAETAALAVLAVVQYAKGDLGSAAAAR